MRRSFPLRRLAALLLFVASPALANLQPATLHLSDRLRVGATDPRDPLPWTPPLSLRFDGDIRTSLIRGALETGQSMLGTDYVLGADRDDAVDCSSLVRRMFGSVGLAVPRTTGEQVSIGRAVTAGQFAPGDLLFYRFGRRGMHVAVYVEGGRVLHASTRARHVVVSRLDEHWTRRMVAARRLF